MYICRHRQVDTRYQILRLPKSRMANNRLHQVQKHLRPAATEDPSRVDGHVILITGGAQGIGRAAALLLSQQGATIAINDLDGSKAQEVVDEIRQLDREAESFPGNVLDEAFPRRLIDDVLRKWGRINGLINNAGNRAPTLPSRHGLP